MQNYYKILGVHRQSTANEIRTRYMKLAWEHHPDRQGDQVMFAGIAEAYAVLHDKARRATYDTELMVYFSPCDTCAGRGAVSRSKGLTSRENTACLKCFGAGYMINDTKKLASKIIVASERFHSKRKDKR